MKDTMSCQHSLSNDVVYKEVVVVGNGPSGMVTSFMLAGNVPYLKEVPADLPLDDMLRARLSNLPKGQSLYETDLLALAEGLEGRGQNPIPLLMDNLLRPCADMGIQADSLIEWKYDVEKQIEHIVLGRGPPGGAWHTFPASVRTLSPGAWLALPPHATAGAGRLPATSVARYCRRYVHACNLTRYFRSGVVVGSVTRAPPAAAAPCGPRCPRSAHYSVSGYDMSEGRPFRFLCRRVVLACGGGDRPNALEPRLASKCLHALGTIEKALTLLAAAEGAARSVMVVGSGVSAADAVCGAARRMLPVRHLHRRAPAALARLDAAAYPDYCQVYKMMCDGASGDYKHYTSYPEHVIVDITPGADDPALPRDLELDYEAIRPKRVTLLNLVTNQLSEVTVSVIAVLIGSKPDLFFLQTNFNLNSIDLEPDCIKCNEKNAKKKIEDERRQCFLRNHWSYIKSVLGQGIQSCKSRYLNYSEINGNTDDTKCVVPDCNRRETKCACDDEEIKTDTSEYDNIPNRIKCQCQPTNPYSNGIGFGIDPKKPVDGRSNPIAIDKSTHELLNAPEGIYALGPLTADNFVRFIPGGALAITAHIHRERKTSAE